MSNFTYFLCTVLWYCQFYSEEHRYKDLETSNINNIFLRSKPNFFSCIDNSSYTNCVSLLSDRSNVYFDLYYFEDKTQTNIKCTSEVPGLPNSKMERTFQIVVRSIISKNYYISDEK